MKGKFVFISIVLALACGVLPITAFAVQPEANTGDGAVKLQAAQTQASVQATKKKAVNKILIASDTAFAVKKIKGYDITGDRKKDVVKFKVSKSSDYWATTLKIFVNGKLACTLRGFQNQGFFPTKVTVKYLRLANGRPFLFVTCNSNNGDGSHDVLQYRKGKLVSMASYLDLPAAYGSHRHLSDAVASGNTVKVTYRYMTFTAGNVIATFPFKVKRGVLKRASATTSDIGYYIQSAGGVAGKYPVTASAAFDVYRDINLKETKGTVRASQEVRINKIRLGSSKLLFWVVSSRGSAGWIEGLKQVTNWYYGGTLFKETYMAG